MGTVEDTPPNLELMSLRITALQIHKKLNIKSKML